MKKQKTKVLISLIMAMCLFLVTFSGCVVENFEEVNIHPVVAEVDNKIKETGTVEGSTKANLYYDNTQSMHGYVCEGSGIISTYTIACNDIVDVIRGYNSYTLNALIANSDELLEWSNLNDAEFDKFKTKDFYTYRGNFDKENGKTGPLQSLFTEKVSPVNFDELNIFITDLAEQDLNIKDFAASINDVVLEKEDHSVALYGIKSMYQGRASVPLAGVVENGMTDMGTMDYNGERPFYCIIVGPTCEVISMCNSLDSTLKSSGLVEGDHFNSVRILSKRGLVYTPVTAAVYEPFADLFVEDDNKNNDYNEFTPDLKFENSNLNYNAVPTSYDKIFTGIDKTYPGLCYNFDDTIANISEDRASISFILPLSDLADGSVANIEEIEYTKERAKLYGYTQKEYTVTDEYGEEEEKIEYVWEEISYFQAFEKNSDSYVTDILLEELPMGSVIDRVSDLANNTALKDQEYPTDKNHLYTVENESGALRVRIDLDNIEDLADKYEVLTLVFSVDASRQISNEVPAWINDYNLSEVDSSNEELRYKKTVNLTRFYEFLIGKMSSEAEKTEFESHMKKTVTDVIVNVYLGQ